MLMYLLLWNLLILSADGTQQHIGAKGHFTCRGIRQPGMFIQLYDEDSIFLLDSDDLMGSTNSDAFGTFCVKGTTYEYSTIEPYILVEHNCGYEGTSEKANLIQYLSPHFITKGNKSFYIEHLGEIELLTEDAPVQKFERRNLVYKHVHRIHQERINECMPLYATYKDFFEKAVFPTSATEKVRDLADGSLANDHFNPVDSNEKVLKASERLNENLLTIVKEEQLLEKIEEKEKHLMKELQKEERKLDDLQMKKKQLISKEKSDTSASAEADAMTEIQNEIISSHKPDKQLDEYNYDHTTYEPEIVDLNKKEKLDEQIVSSSLQDEYDPCAFRRKRFPHVPFRRSDPCYKHLRKPYF